MKITGYTIGWSGELTLQFEGNKVLLPNHARKYYPQFFAENGDLIIEKVEEHLIEQKIRMLEYTPREINPSWKEHMDMMLKKIGESFK